MAIKYFNIAEYEQKFKPTSIFIGARRIGKTFSAFSYIYERPPFLYARNTEVELDECCTLFGNPFKKWNKVLGKDLHMKKEKKHALILEETGDNEHVVGYGAALSLLGSMRGVDLSDIKVGLLDEFIEKKRLTFDQAKNYDDLYETINGNRELEGEPPFIFLLLSNAQKLDNSILASKNLITPIEGLIRSGQKSFSTKDCLVVLPESEVSDLKKSTAFYQGMEGTKTYQEAIENKFANDSFYGIVKRPLKEYIGVCVIDGIYIYKHKSNGKYYACHTQCSNIPTFTSKDNFALFYRAYGHKFDIMAATGQLEYADFTTKSGLNNILRI